MLIKRNIFFLLLFGMLSWSLHAQVQEDVLPEARYQQEEIPERSLDEKKWEELTKDLDYSEKTKSQRRRDNLNNREDGEGRGAGAQRKNPFSLEQGSGIMKFLIILLAVVVVVLLMRGLLGSDLKVKNKKIKKVDQIDIERIEEDIENADLPDFIRQALANEQYALAIRLYYLAALKELSLRKDIRWKKDKTNLDYLREMRSSEHYSSFKSLTAIFERVWYGERMLDREGFQQLEPDFQLFINQLKADVAAP
jgi:hypothetical protein